MSGNGAKKAVKSFLRQYGIDKVSADSLYTAVGKVGYTLVEFNSSCNDENVSLLVGALGLTKQIAVSRGFTYAKGEYRLVFVNEGLSDNEKCVVLAHELGHIFMGHLQHSAVIGNDVSEEYEANEFAHYLLKSGTVRKIPLFVREHRRLLIILTAVVFVLAGAFTAYGVVSFRNTYHGNYYVTVTGEKYHRKDCSYIQGKKDISRLTEEDYNSGKYTPCAVCKPGE